MPNFLSGDDIGQAIGKHCEIKLRHNGMVRPAPIRHRNVPK